MRSEPCPRCAWSRDSPSCAAARIALSREAESSVGRASIGAPMAQLARFSPAAVVQRITRSGDVLAEPSHTIDEIVIEAARHRPTIDQGLIRRAYDTAVTAHEGQLRS